MRRAADYRCHAAKCRRLAETTADPEQRGQLLRLAGELDLTALEQESMLRPGRQLR